MRNPSSKLVFTADLGRLRAFRFLPIEDNPHRSYSIEEFDPPEVNGQAETPQKPGRFQDRVSDQAGRFPSQGSGMSVGEAGLNERERQEERKLIQHLAERINKTVEQEGLESWNLAAPQPILQHLLSSLDKSVRERLTSTEGHDYTKLPVKKIEEIFAGLR